MEWKYLNPCPPPTQSLPEVLAGMEIPLGSWRGCSTNDHLIRDGLHNGVPLILSLTEAQQSAKSFYRPPLIIHFIFTTPGGRQLSKLSPLCVLEKFGGTQRETTCLRYRGGRRGREGVQKRG